MTTNDKEVHHPDHYTVGGIETKDYVLAKLGVSGYVSYCIGNILKYVSRAMYKGKMRQDLEKAKFYIDEILNHVA